MWWFTCLFFTPDEMEMVCFVYSDENTSDERGGDVENK